MQGTDFDRMMVFGQWLTEQTLAREFNLFSVCSNVKAPVDAIRMEYGKLEAYKFILKAFKDLYDGNIESFKRDYISEEKKTEKNEQTIESDTEDDRDGEESPTGFGY